MYCASEKSENGEERDHAERWRSVRAALWLSCIMLSKLPFLFSFPHFQILFTSPVDKWVRMRDSRGTHSAAGLSPQHERPSVSLTYYTVMGSAHDTTSSRTQQAVPGQSPGTARVRRASDATCSRRYRNGALALPYDLPLYVCSAVQEEERLGRRHHLGCGLQ
jgi:hypothetical protein